MLLWFENAAIANSLNLDLNFYGLSFLSSVWILIIIPSGNCVVWFALNVSVYLLLNTGIISSLNVLQNCLTITNVFTFYLCTSFFFLSNINFGYKTKKMTYNNTFLFFVYSYTLKCMFSFVRNFLSIKCSLIYSFIWIYYG